MENFKDLRKLKKEIEQLESTYRDYLCVPSEYVADTAKDYTQGIARTIVVSGYGDPKYARVRQSLIIKRKKLLEQIEAIEKALDSEDNAETRTILRMYYVDGLTQQEIADKLHYSVETIKRRMKGAKDERDY